jgi:hypothetical protein
MFPYRNQLFRLTLPGRVLREALSLLVKRRYHMLISGGSYSWKEGAEPGLVEMRVAGQPLEEDREYVVLINSFAHRRDPLLRTYPVISLGDCASLLEGYLKEQKTVSPKLDGRRKQS